MNRAYLGLGSNVGDKSTMLAEAIRHLGATSGIDMIARSRNYRTPPWGDTDQDWFLNAAIGVDTRLTPHQLLAAGLAVEASLGRVRLRRWGPRLIDIDVLHYADVELNDDRLVLPHRYLRERAFVLAPLAEIAPDLVIGSETVREALAKLDQAGIEPVSR